MRENERQNALIGQLLKSEQKGLKDTDGLFQEATEGKGKMTAD